MAEFSYFGDWNDAWFILEIIMSVPGLRFVPDIIYKKQKVVYFEDFDSYRRSVRHPSKGYIWGPFSEVRPVFFNIGESGKSKNGDKYVIDLIGGGMKFQFQPCGLYDLGDFTNISIGSISYQQWYFRGNSEETVFPDARLKDAYRQITNRLKRYLIRKKIKRSFWIGPSALKLVQAGEAKITAKGIVG